MAGQIVVITTGIRLSAKKIRAGSHAMGPKGVLYAKLISKMFFLGWGE
jgi:uncharacterized protein YaiI (UPF0178 family)